MLRLIWSGRLECVFVDPKGAKISKNGNKITCRLSKNKHFLFFDNLQVILLSFFKFLIGL